MICLVGQMLQDLKDSTDRTALALAEDQRKRGKEGAVGVSDCYGKVGHDPQLAVFEHSWYYCAKERSHTHKINI